MTSDQGKEILAMRINRGISWHAPPHYGGETNLVGYDRLVADIQSVLNTLVSKEVAVQTTGGNWFRMNIQPYRTLENVIEGAVITFVDITELIRTREALDKASGLSRLGAVVRDMAI